MVSAVAGPVATAGGHVVNGKLDRTTNHLTPPTWYFPQREHRDHREADAPDTGPYRRHAALRETEATVRAVDYQVIGGGAEEFRVYSDDEDDVARWRRVETPVRTRS